MEGLILTAATTDLFAFDEPTLDELSTRHATPFFAYDLGAARERFARLRAALEPVTAEATVIVPWSPSGR